MNIQTSLTFTARILCVSLLIGNVYSILNKNNEEASIEDFPEMVQLTDRHLRIHECGGFIVSPLHVVTAAHCILKAKKHLNVIANATSSKEGGIERFIVDAFIPEKYDKKTKDWDVAVLKLNEPLPFGKGIQKAELCKTRWGRQGRIRIAGWGKTSRDALASSSTLMAATVTTISDNKCKERLSNIRVEVRPNKYRKYEFGETMSCALAKNHVDACQGDSGGPAYLSGKVCGIVSWGFDCGRGKFPSFYTSIPKVQKFIDDSMLK